MALTDDDFRAIVQSWWKRHDLKPQCPFCKSLKWTTGIACDLPARFTSGKVFPVIPIVCSGCAYTLFLSGDVVMKPPEQAPSPAGQKRARRKAE